MSQVNMHDAKTRLSKLVHDLESGREEEIVIARNGKPVARLVRADDAQGSGTRIGIAKGAFRLPDQTRELDREVAALFAAENAGRKRADDANGDSGRDGEEQAGRGR